MSEFTHLSDENAIRMDCRVFVYYRYHSPHFTRRTIKRCRAAPEWVPDPYLSYSGRLYPFTQNRHDQ